MASLKISQLPLSTDYHSTSAFIPAIVDGLNVRFSSADILEGASGNTSNWKYVMESQGDGTGSDSDTDVANVADGARKIVRWNNMNIFSAKTSTLNEETGLASDGEFIVRMPSGNSQISRFQFQMKNDKSFFAYVTADGGVPVGFALSRRYDSDAAHLGGPEVIGLPLSLEQRGTQPDHALRKDQIEELLAAQRTQITWKNVIQSTPANDYGVLPKGGSRAIFNNKLQQLFSISGAYDYNMGARERNGSINLRVPSSLETNKETRFYVDDETAEMSSYDTSTVTKWGFFVSRDDSTNIVYKDDLYGVILQTPHDDVEATIDVFGLPLGLKQPATEPHHAVRKDQVDGIVSSVTESIKIGLNEPTTPISESFFTEDTTTTTNFHQVWLSGAKLTENKALSKIAIHKPSSGNGTTTPYYMAVYQNDGSSYILKGFSTNTNFLGVNSPEWVEWKFPYIELEANKDLVFVGYSSKDFTGNWNRGSITMLRTDTCSTAIASECDMSSTTQTPAASLMGSTPKFQYEFVSMVDGTLNIYDVQDEIGAFKEEYEGHISNEDIHTPTEQVLNKVDDELLSITTPYSFVRDASPTNNATFKTVFLDGSKVKGGIVHKISIRGATSSGISTQRYLALYQVNEEGTAWEWIGCSKNTDNMAANPSEFHVWEFDETTKVAAGRKIGIVALLNAGKPDDVNTAAQNMRAGTVAFEAGTTTVSTEPLELATATIYEFSIGFMLEMTEIVGRKYLEVESIPEKSDNLESYPVAKNSDGALCVSITPWKTTLLTEGTIIPIQNNAVYSFAADNKVSSFVINDYLRLNGEGLSMFFIGIPIQNNDLTIKTTNQYTPDAGLKAYQIEDEGYLSVFRVTGYQAIVLECKYLNAGAINQAFLNLVNVF